MTISPISNANGIKAFPICKLYKRISVRVKGKYLSINIINNNPPTAV